MHHATREELALWRSRARSLRNLLALSAVVAFLSAYAILEGESADRPSAEWGCLAAGIGVLFVAGAFAASRRPYAWGIASAATLGAALVALVAFRPFEPKSLRWLLWPLGIAVWARELRGADGWIRANSGTWERLRRDPLAIDEIAPEPPTGGVRSQPRRRRLHEIGLAAVLAAAIAAAGALLPPSFDARLDEFRLAWNSRRPARLDAAAPGRNAAALVGALAAAGLAPRDWPRLSRTRPTVVKEADRVCRVEFAVAESPRRLVSYWRLEDREWTVRSIALSP